jgi:ATP-dependent protease HslVU (ClpYQ) peptidase subunit
MLGTMHCASLTLRKLLSREHAGDADERDDQRHVVQVGVGHRYYLAEAAAVVRAHQHKRSALSQHAVGAAVGTPVGAAGGASNSQRAMRWREW